MLRTLNSQLALRLGGILLLILLCLSVQGIWMKELVNDKAKATQLANAREHYAAVLADLDRRWGREAFNLKTRLEAQEILANPELRKEKLMVYLISQGNSIEFPSLRIETTHGELIAAYDYASHIDTSVKFLPGQTNAWAQNPKDGSLYLVIRQFIWLGKENGYLVLLKPMDHALLTQITYPGTRLSLWFKGKPVASSDGDEGLQKTATAFPTPEAGSANAYLTWSGPESETSPKLLIEPLASELIGIGSIARPIMLVFFILLIAVTVGFSGLWLRASRQLDALLQADQRYKALNTIDDAVVDDLRTAQTGPIESARSLATSLELRMRASGTPAATTSSTTDSSSA
ncbi:hypothetical protein LZ012_09295 [Dechloromonas sp. XY25]|uniref:Uncharacterized protein n=1 Tax=Dechloromonas hankyongensis TaxID=2908002 RepID=A0ABS9K1X8_9RHOO|nr:hypothetical protein [Dechloromonas hankyongensis]MCG2577192.1 hypothetical protein [Dechloromonas hankyongensis]